VKQHLRRYHAVVSGVDVADDERTVGVLEFIIFVVARNPRDLVISQIRRLVKECIYLIQERKSNDKLKVWASLSGVHIFVAYTRSSVTDIL